VRNSAPAGLAAEAANNATASRTERFTSFSEFADLTTARLEKTTNPITIG
jgi:hypothetical protein